MFLPWGLLAMGWTVQGLNPAGGEIFCTCPDWSWGPPSLLYSGSFPGVKSSRGVTLTPHPLLVPWSRKSRTIPLLPLWAIQPVQSLSACTRVHFTFFYMGLILEVCKVQHLLIPTFQIYQNIWYDVYRCFSHFV